MKNKMVSLLTAIIMILAISGCTTQADGSSGADPDAVHQIEEDSVAIYDESNRVTDGSNGQEQNISAESYEGKNSTAENNHALEGVEEHVLTGKDVTKNFSEDKCESYSFFDVEPGQYAVCDIIYTVGEDKSSFEYAINWEPMGNYIRVGLINTEMNDSYFVSCISGRSKGNIDIAEIPFGDYYVFVYNETSSEISLNGTVAYILK